MSGEAETPVQSGRRPIAQLLLVFCFLGGIATPIVAYNVTPRPDFVYSAGEYNFRWSPRPKAGYTISELSAFPPKFDRWYAFSFGLRDKLIRYHNIMKWMVLKSSPTPNLVQGEDGWLFHRWGMSLENYCGIAPFDERMLAAWSERLEARRDWFARQGIDYLLFVVPNKAGAYPERMPGRIARVGESQFDGVLRYMREHASFAPIDLRPALEAEKQNDRGDDLTYFRLGTHWTERGAQAAYREIVRHVAALPSGRYAGMKPWKLDDFERVVADNPGDSWAQRMYMTRELPQTNYVFTPRRERPASPVDYPVGQVRAQRWRNTDQSLPRIHFVHDSFGELLIPLLAQHCSDMISLRQNGIDGAVIRELAPDIVVQVFCERVFATAPNALEGPDSPGSHESGAPVSDSVDVEAGFRRSTDVRLRLDATGGFERLTARGKTELRATEGVEVGAAGLEIVTVDPADTVLLPVFSFDDRNALGCDITAPFDTRLDLFYLTGAGDGYRRENAVPVQLRAGRNRFVVELAAEGLTGRLLLRPGSETGRFVLHLFEVRGLRD